MWPHSLSLSLLLFVAHAPAGAVRGLGNVDGHSGLDRWAEARKRTRFRQDMPDYAAFTFVPFAVESCGYLGNAVVAFSSELGEVAAAGGWIAKA